MSSSFQGLQEREAGRVWKSECHGTGHGLGVGDEDPDGEMCSCPIGLQRRGYKDLTLHKQTAVSQTGKAGTTLGRHIGSSPKSLPADEGEHNFTNDSLMEHRQGQCPPVPLLWIVTLQITGTDSGDVPDYLCIHLLLVSTWSTIHQLDLCAAS